MTQYKQRGISLITSLIMLILITMMVLMTYKLTTSNSKIVINNQIKAELYSANAAALDTTISDSLFLNGTVSAVTIKLYETGQGETSAQKDISVTITPACVKTRIIPNKDAFVVSPDCIWDADTGGLYVEGQTSGGNLSLCANALWDIRATATDPFTGTAKAETHEGVEVTTDRTATAVTACGV